MTRNAFCQQAQQGVAVTAENGAPLWLPAHANAARPSYINPNASPPPRITPFSKPGCPHCARARKMLADKGYRFEEIELGSHGISYSSLQAVTGRGTTPQVYIDGQHLGGADELTTWLAK